MLYAQKRDLTLIVAAVVLVILALGSYAITQYRLTMALQLSQRALSESDRRNWEQHHWSMEERARLSDEIRRLRGIAEQNSQVLDELRGHAIDGSSRPADPPK